VFGLGVLVNVVFGSGLLEPSLLVIVVAISGVPADAVFGLGVIARVVAGPGVLGPNRLVIVVARPSLLADVVFGPISLVIVVLRVQN
jgi:hypothetical protein